MADGGDEHLMFVRKADHELHDIGLVNLNCRQLVIKLDYMFGSRKGVLKGPSFTNVMLNEWLSEPIICPLDYDGIHIVGVHGGLTDAELEPCWAEMQA